jgi:ubiquinone/menaquinone biosynthesis C-methylase UbiE
MSGGRSETALPAHRQLSEPAYKGSFVERYNDLRPKPPAELIELLSSLAPVRPPSLVIDLGAGTGISTIPWSRRADRVVGVEINPEMSRLAPRRGNVEYIDASADKTGLPDSSAEVITCAQSFHWMAPETTIPEIARLLRPNGIFAAYDYDWPPVVDWEVDAAFLQVIEASGVDPARPEKAGHVRRLQESGCFRAVREVFVHSCEHADAERIARLPLAFGPVARRLMEGKTPAQLGLEQLQEVVERRLGSVSTVLRWSYRVRIALKQTPDRTE